MHFSSHIHSPLAIFLAGVQLVSALGEPCPIIGAYYPVPTTVSGSINVQNAIKSAQDQLASAFVNGTLDGNETSLSVNVYSLEEEGPLFTFHYTPELHATERTAGVVSVDSNTIYRIGSVSKLWTAYLYLITAGDRSWNYPVTDFIPELAAVAEEKKASSNPVDHVAWEDITVGALAAHLAGVSREPSWSAELATALEALGLPDQGGQSHSTCGNAEQAFVASFFEDYTQRHPTTNPFQTPAYSNGAYQILAYVLQNITGRSIEEDFQTRFVSPLGLNATYYRPPSESVSNAAAFIPGNVSSSWWDSDLLDETPAGGYYSTLNDMTKVGRAMLNHTLLSPAQTRRWMKPHAFTSDPRYAVGAPWEIVQAPGSSPSSWIYTKTGDLGAYSGVQALMPDLNIGMNILAAGARSGDQARVAADILAGAFVPAFWAQAKNETEIVYAGTYADPDQNSTIAVATADDAPGLVVQEFIIGGQDVLAALEQLLKSKFTLRLYPMGLSASGPKGTTTESWRAIFETPASLSLSDSTSCISWFLLNQYTYGGVGLDEFLFTTDAGRKSALAIESRIAGVGIAKNEPMISDARRLAKWAA